MLRTIPEVKGARRRHMQVLGGEIDLINQEEAVEAQTVQQVARESGRAERMPAEKNSPGTSTLECS